MEREELCAELERKRARKARQAKNFAFKMLREARSEKREARSEKREARRNGFSREWEIMFGVKMPLTLHFTA